MVPAVFLDRDGTLIEEVGYLDRVERVSMYPWSIDAVRLLNAAGFRVVVVTNQSGVARGMFDEQTVSDVHAHLATRMAAAGARIDAFYYCPHHPDAPIAAYRAACDCRKPLTGMVRRAERDLSLDLARSFVVGDRWLDVALARAVDARGILVRTGYGRTEEDRVSADGTAVTIADNLLQAVAWILQTVAAPSPAVTTTPCT